MGMDRDWSWEALPNGGRADPRPSNNRQVAKASGIAGDFNEQVLAGLEANLGIIHGEEGAISARGAHHEGESRDDVE